jgi:hypothetical protein
MTRGSFLSSRRAFRRMFILAHSGPAEQEITSADCTDYTDEGRREQGIEQGKNADVFVRHNSPMTSGAFGLRICEICVICG